MSLPALDSPIEQTLAVAAQRDQGLQMRLFPAHAADDVDAEVDLRISDEMAGMYYIG